MDEITVEPGMYEGIPMDAYHSGPGVSRSDLKLIGRSPAHYWIEREDPDREPEKREPNLGSVVHKLVLEPMSFGDEFVVMPEGLDRRTKAGKAEWARLQELAGPHGTVIPKATHDTALLMALAVRSHPTASSILLGDGVVQERTFYWTDPITGLLCKMRPDAYCDEWMGDLKWVDDARPAAFMRNLGKHRWDLQAAWYGDGAMAVRGHRPPFVFVAVEEKPPHGIGIYTLRQEDVAQARDENRANLDTLAECRRTGLWPGYTIEAQEVSVPRWASPADD